MVGFALPTRGNISIPRICSGFFSSIMSQINCVVVPEPEGIDPGVAEPDVLGCGVLPAVAVVKCYVGLT